MNILEFREKYPGYNHVSDEVLADKLHQKYYSHVPKEEFISKFIGQPIQENNVQERIPSGGLPFIEKFAQLISKSPSASKAIQFIAKGAKPFNEAFESTGIPALAGGAIQGLADTEASLSNIPLGALSQALGKDLTVDHQNFREKLPAGLVNDVAFGAGEFGSSLGGAGATYKAANLLSKLPQAQKIGSLLKELSPEKLKTIFSALPEIAKGAATGAAIGEDMPGGRTGNALLGGAIPAVGTPLRAGAKKLSSLRSKNIAERFVEEPKQNAKIASKMYDKVWNAKEGIGKSKVPLYAKGLGKDLKFIAENELPNYTENLEKFLKNPNLENAHWAKSDLKYMVRNIYKNKKITGKLDPWQNKVFKTIKKSESELDTIMKRVFDKSGEPNIAKDYKKANNYYRENVGKYNNSSLVQKLNPEHEQALFPKQFVDRAAKSRNFNHKFAEKHPEIAQRRKLKELINKTGKTGKYATYTSAGIGIPLGILHELFKKD